MSEKVDISSEELSDKRTPAGDAPETLEKEATPQQDGNNLTAPTMPTRRKALEKTASLGKETPSLVAKAAAWTFGNIRKPFLEHIKKTDKGVTQCWGKRRSSVVTNPVAVGMQVMRRFSRGEIVTTDLGELDSMLEPDQQEDQTQTQVSWRGMAALLLACMFSICASCIMWTTDAFDKFVARQMILDDSSTTFGWWISPPINPWLHVYLWNYTNWDDYLRNNKTKIKLQEVGPYVFRENIKRSDIKFNSDKTLISYKETKHYEYFPERSAYSINATVRVPNMPYISAVAKMQSAFLSILSPLLRTLSSEPLLDIQAGDFMWGYDDRLFTLSKLNPTGDSPPTLKFGLLAQRIIPDLVTIQTGKSDVGKLAYISRFNSMSRLNAYTDPACNSIEGTDGSMFPPLMIKKKQDLKAFKAEACRLVDFSYKESTMAQGVRAYRYRIPPGLFLSPRTRPEELCYCNKTDLNECPLDGAFSTSSCAYGAPVMVSFPHFYRGDPKLQEPFDGLVPNEEKHDMFADIHPRLGITMQGRSRLQVNIQIVRHWSHGHLSVLPDKLILPVAWVEQSLPAYSSGFQAFLLISSYGLDITEFVVLYILPIVAVITAFFILRRLIRGRRRLPLEGRYSLANTAEDDRDEKA